MNLAQQTALEGMYKRSLTVDEVALLDTHLAIRNDVALTELINAAQSTYLKSLYVEEVFDILYLNGDYIVLKNAQLLGNANAIAAFSALSDSKTLGKGLVNFFSPITTALLDALQADNLLTQTGRDALTLAATAKSKVYTVDEVSRILNIAENRMVM